MITVLSATTIGMESTLVEIEVDIKTGLPQFELVGLPGKAVRESRERVRSALKNSGYQFPLGRITVNLAPADIPKEGPAFDLPIALGILACMGVIPKERLSEFLIRGELSLSGRVRPVSGVLATTCLASERDINVVVPKENAWEASGSFGCNNLIAICDLRQAIAFFRNEAKITPIPRFAYQGEKVKPTQLIKGQYQAKRALKIAMSGKHHLLLIGPPGVGKTLLAHQGLALMPPLTQSEAIEVTKVYSSAKMLAKDGLLKRRPFRAPHHVTTSAALIGGGNPPRPGEVTLAHKGILLLDEFNEFSDKTIQTLREPLDSREVTIVRAGNRYTFPADFVLIATANPCPCGFLGDSLRACTCKPWEIRRYQKRLSGPIIDRFDLFCFMPRLSESEQRHRASFPDCSHRFSSNGSLSPSQIEKLPVTYSGKEFLLKACARFSLSTRANHKILKVAKTIAELQDEVEISTEHIAEALQFRWENYSTGPHV